MRRSISLFGFVLALVLLLSLSVVSAQSAQNVESFIFDGQTHLLQYPQNYADSSATIKAAFADVVPVYEKYWNAAGSGTMDFRVFVVVGMPQGANPDPSNVAIQSVALPIPSSPWNGKSEATKTTVCEVQLFSPSSANIFDPPQRLQFEVALDLAQCYIEHYANPPANPPDWWFKGLSYWMALKVYPPPPDVLIKLQKDYKDNYNANLLNAGEESVYFWEYMLGSDVPATIKSSIPGSLPVAVNGLKGLSGTVTFFTPDLFYAYAQAVNAYQLVWQPTPDDLAQDETVAYFPDDVDLELEENSIVIETVALPKLDSDEGITIKAEELTDNSIIASVSAGDKGTFMLADGASVKICNPPDSLTVVAGRGPTSQGADAGLTVDKVEHCNPTPEVTATPQVTATPSGTEQAGLPSCIVGKFNIRFPYMESVMPFGGGTWQFTFNSDGSYDLLAQGLTFTEEQASLVYSYDYKGRIGIVPDPQTPNRFNVTSFSYQMMPGAKALVTAGGMTMDMSGIYLSNNQVSAQPAYITCANSSASNPTVTYYLTAEYPLILTRTT